MKKVTLEFLYDEVKGEDDEYYKNLAWDEIYGRYDYVRDFKVEDIGD